MTQRTYKLRDLPHGQIGSEIAEFPEPGRCVLHLMPGYRLDSPADAVDAIQRAYRDGREDRAGEILGDEGLDRAIAAVAGHAPRVLRETLLESVAAAPAGGSALAGAEVNRCKCGRYSGTTMAQWQAHLAYEILQAAATLPKEQVTT